MSWRVTYIFQKLLIAWSFSCINKKLLFYQGDGYLWPHCCMKNLYISHRSPFSPTYSFWAIDSMLISRFWVTSWVLFRLQYCDTLGELKKKKIYINTSCNYPTTIWQSISAQIYKFLVEQYNFPISAYKCFKIKSKKCKSYKKYIHCIQYLGQNTYPYCSWITVVLVHD